MLDEKGRLFGKINIVDLLIIVVIVAAIAFIGIKFVMPHSDNSPKEKMEMVIYVEESERFVTDQLVIGSPVHDDTDSVDLGVCKACKIEPFYEPFEDVETKQIVKAEVDHKCVVELTVEVEGTNGTYGATVDGYLFGIGHTLVVSAGNCKFYGAVKSITVIK